MERLVGAVGANRLPQATSSGRGKLVTRLLVTSLVMQLSHQFSAKASSIAHHNHHQQQRLPQDTRKSQQANDRVQADPKLATTTSSSNNKDNSALVYLQKFGYMSPPTNSESNSLISEDSFSNAIMSFQKFASLPETGVADEQTLQYMQLPRCGNKDKSQADGEQQQHRRRSSGFSRIGQLELRNNSLGAVQRRRKRYALQGSKWRRQELTYRISQYPTRFHGKRHEVDSQIERAFGIWSQVAPIDFVVKKEGRVHIDIRFASGDHGDGDAFDGPGNTLAHAYFPQYGGDAHFDDQEYWTIDSYTGTNIFQVAAHELGHSLGLGHSNVREALMAPFYQKYKPNFKLHMDDVLAIQALYGEKPFLQDPPSLSSLPTSTSTTTSTTTTTTTTSTQQPPPLAAKPPQAGTRYRPHHSKPGVAGGRRVDGRETNDDDENLPDLSHLPGNGIAGADSPDSESAATTTTASTTGAPYPIDLCTDSTIDAITRTNDGQSYVFKGDYYWLLTTEGLAKGYPKKISADWDGLPGSLDAALTWADGKTFFFKGNKYWRFRNKRRDVGYPKLISAGFAGIPDNIDAAFVWSGNGRTYIFKGAEYWRFDSKADPPVSSEYPRSIKVWNGVPAHVNAAFRWENNVTYFFKGNQYYRFNDKEFRAETRGRPPFPRLSSEWWFGCTSSNLAQRALSSSLRDYVGEIGGTNYTGTSQDIDWSFYGGEENTRIMGTHISDHKPSNDTEGVPVMVSSEPNIAHFHQRTTTNIGHHNQWIGLFHPTMARSTAISSTLTSLSSSLVLLALSSFSIFTMNTFYV